MKTVGQKLVSSAGWSVGGDVVVVLSGAAAALVAARLVPPAEIGLVATVSLLLALLETLTASGVEQALVQRAEHEERLIDAGWTWQLGRGVFLGACLAAAAPLLAEFYEMPALLPLALVLALQPVLRGAANMAMVVRIRALDFRAVFMLNATPALSRLLTVVVLCLLWRNAWALIAGALAEHAARLLVSFLIVRRAPKLRFAWAEMRAILRYGRWITALSILTYLNTRGDDLFVSKRFGPSELAIYQLAFAIANVPVTGISRVVARVTFPAYARLAADPERLRALFLEVFRLTAFAALVAWAVLYFGFAYVPAVVGPQWAEVVAVGRVLAFAGVVRALMNTGGPLFQGTGKPELDVHMNLPRLVLLIATLWPLSAAFGLPGVGAASWLAICACIPVWAIGVRQQAGVTLWQIGQSLGAALLSAGLTAAILGTLAWLLPTDLVGLVVFVLLGGALSYAAIAGCERAFGIALRPSLRGLQAL